MPRGRRPDLNAREVAHVLRCYVIRRRLTFKSAPYRVATSPWHRAIRHKVRAVNVAKRLGVHPHAIYDYERGAPSLEEWLRGKRRIDAIS